MIELIVSVYLSSMTSIPVFVEDEPENNTAEEFLLIRNTGSSVENYMEHSTIAIESYSTSTLKAKTLDDSVREWMDSIITEKQISKISLNTSYKDNDSARKRYRYRSVFAIVLF